jgi:hypothetical protein
MIFKSYIGYTKLYVVQRHTGVGILCNPHIPQEVVGEFDDKEEAIRYADELRRNNNSAESFKNNWVDNTYKVNINLINEKGVKMLERAKKGNLKFRRR